MDTIVTRGKRIDYFALNDGSDEEAPLEDRLDSSHPHESSDSLPDCEIFRAESPSSQEIPDDAAQTFQPLPQSSRDIQLSNSESKSWQCWDYFDITEVNRPWILKKSNKLKKVDREIVVQYWTRKLSSNVAGRQLTRRDRARLAIW
ncbi:hypothetical protein V1525DRAFT_440558 [Lipomyces kononenkoae]|uniref:Uncharacterized protein n=1 Tax=Lipomyces kononenkoae TaxID=34357 RepID=A0ACC3SQI0_LIPKO